MPVAGAAEAAHAIRRLAIANVNVISMIDGVADTCRTVVVEGDRIVAVVGPDEYRFVPGDTLVRGAGLWLMPGLIDPAVATGDPAELRLRALEGITTVGMVDESALTRLRPLVSGAGSRMPDLCAAPVPRERPVGVGPASGRAAGPDGNVRIAPSDLVEDLLDRAKAGESAPNLLRAATRDAALALRRGDIGRIAPGTRADLVLLEADPRVQIGSLRAIRAIVLRGEYVTRAEIESTRDRCEALNQSAAHAFEHMQPPPDWSQDGIDPWRRTFMLRFDGLPQGALRCMVRQRGGAFESFSQREMWSPLYSRTTIVAQHDRGGGIVSATIVHEDPAAAFSVEVERAGSAWRLLVDDEDGQRCVAIPDEPTPSPDRSGCQPRVAAPLPTDRPVEDCQQSPSPTLILDLLPSIPDLVQLLGSRQTIVRRSVERPTVIRSDELAYGAGRLAWNHVDIAVRERVATPEFDRIEQAVAAALPAGCDVGTIWIGPRRTTSLLWDLGVPREAWRQLVRITIGLDANGWPAEAVIAVPEGLWQVHDWDAPAWAGTHRTP
ncbi:MAG: hypothetical protein U0575_09975 [Phycisphaerales bacterium]